MESAFSSISFPGLVGNPLCVGKKKVRARRISVSSSESDNVDIKEVLEGVVRDYAATHARSTRPTEGPSQAGKKDKRSGCRIVTVE